MYCSGVSYLEIAAFISLGALLVIFGFLLHKLITKKVI